MLKRRSCLILSAVLIGFMVFVAVTAVTLASIEVRDGLSIIELVYYRVWFATRETDVDQPAGTDPTLVLFEVNSGDTAAVIGENLASMGLIADVGLFRNYVRYHGLDSALEAGTYFLSQTQGTAEIADALTDSSTASVSVQIIEGWRREEIAEAIDDKPLLRFSGADFLAATGSGAVVPQDFVDYVDLPAGATLEGFLYPDTYFVSPGATASDFRNTLLGTFIERIDPGMKMAAETAGFTLYEAVTLASIIDREAVKSDEQPLIASVYLNRLEIDMKLDADPTVQYGIGYRDGAWWPSITQGDYQTAISPYNTYLNPGLPPGPIANPSQTAVHAALFPAESGYYYFRADCAGSGYHVFATTFEEHVANGICQ